MNKYLLAVLLMGNSLIQAQQLQEPFNFPLLLSGNFGELRSNHFHSGIDFKTQGVEGKPVMSVQDGYVSRISINAWGYGYALYINHPDGTTTVYAHLQRFAPNIAEYARSRQHFEERFNIDETLPERLIPVKRGEVVAYSGNTGSSGGPHLHFEVRDTKTEDIIDPLDFFKDKLKDNRPPQIKGVMVCPVEGKGVANGKSNSQILKLVTAKNGRQAISSKIEAWGEIGLAVKAVDLMDNTNNVYGVKEILLTQDNDTVFYSNLDRYGFHETRYLNSFVDYEKWKKNHLFYMRSFVEPGNKLQFIKASRRGILKIDEEKTYHLKYKLKDAFGNSTELSVWIDGKKQPIPEVSHPGTELFSWTGENRFGSKGIRLTIPKGALYDDCHFSYSLKEDPDALASTHFVHDEYTPIHIPAQLSLRLQKDSAAIKAQYGIVKIKNGTKNWVGGTYRDGWIDADIRELGSYSIAQDTTPPKIVAINPEKWMANKRFSFRLGDDMSGVRSFRGEVDDQFVLFEMNNKSVINYRLEDSKFKNGKRHQLKLIVIDAVGNEEVYTHSFVY